MIDPVIAARLILPALLLSGCEFFSPRTSMTVSYQLPDGRAVQAQYSSTKDVEAPAFVLKRGPDGQIQEIAIGAGSAMASPVVDAHGVNIERLGAAVGAGIGAAARQGLLPGLAP